MVSFAKSLTLFLDEYLRARAVGLGYLWLSPDTMNNQVYESIPEDQVCDQGTDNLIILE
jgi:hypothetical protein